MKILPNILFLLTMFCCSTTFSQNIFNQIGKGDLKEVKLIIDEDEAQLNTLLEGAYTPLSFASMIGNDSIVSYLLFRGADPNFAEKSVKSPLFQAVYRGHLNIVKILIDNGTSIDDETMGMSLLHTAVWQNHMEATKFLLSCGMDINSQDSYGLTPLHMAVELGHLDMCKLLIAKGADLNTRSNNATTPFQLSEETNQKAISQFLISKGAKRVSRDFPVYKGKYFGAKNPGTTLELFEPNRAMRIIGAHSGVAVSRDGKEIFWVRGDYSGKIWQMKEVDGVWTTPRIAPFSGDFDNSYPCFSVDGQRLFFTSDRPKEQDGEYKKGVGDIWFAEKTENEWSEAVNAGPGVNTNGDEFIASIDKNNTLYFTRVLFQNGKVNSDIFFSKFTDGNFQTAVMMDTAINTPRFEVGPFISPEGDYIIFGSQRFGEMTTCISYRMKNGEWTVAKDIQSVFDPFTGSYVQGITADGRFILFAGAKEKNWDIYWISSEIIQRTPSGKN
nr:ankyrin repeat domain-containing protein [Bacteroidota bacterium]